MSKSSVVSLGPWEGRLQFVTTYYPSIHFLEGLEDTLSRAPKNLPVLVALGRGDTERLSQVLWAPDHHPLPWCGHIISTLPALVQKTPAKFLPPRDPCRQGRGPSYSLPKPLLLNVITLRFSSMLLHVPTIHSFLLLSNIPSRGWTTISLFIHFLMDNLNRFQFGAITNKVATFTQVFIQTYVFILLGKYIEVYCLDHRVEVCLAFHVTAKPFF